MTFEYKRLLKVLTAVSLFFLLTSCGLGSAPKGRKPSPDWSRGAPLSTSVAGTADLAVVGGGKRFT